MRNRGLVQVVVKIMMVVLTIMIFVFDSFAQNLHTALWNFGNKCLDFRSGEPIVKDLPKHTFGMYEVDDDWYVDESGELVLRYSSHEKKLYGKNGELVRGYEAFASKIGNSDIVYVPRPKHPNQVYCISNVSVVVDVEKNELVGDVVDYIVPSVSQVIVHSVDCSFLWHVQVGRDELIVNEVGENGIFFRKQIDIENWWPPTTRREIFRIVLSSDCNFFCAVSPGFPRMEEPVIFGKFDRETCDFKLISKHVFQQNDNRQRYLYSIISPLNKYLYLLVMPDASGDIEICDIKRVPIVNSVPDYDGIELVKRIAASSSSYFRYAIDGNIYICDDGRRRIARLVDPDAEETFFEGDIVVDDSRPYSGLPKGTQYFISSWVTSDYCYDGISATMSCNDVNFYCSTSIVAKSFLWDFGDGARSSEVSPSHIYDTPGVYDVSVKVVFEDDTSKMYTRRVSVAPVPETPKVIME